MTKAELRKQMLAELRALPEPERARRSAAIAARLCELPAWQSARCIAAFSPLPTEPDLNLDLLAKPDSHAGSLPADDRRYCYPRCTGSVLRYYEVRSREQLLPSDRSRLLEPDPDSCSAVALEEIDLVLVPGLAFDPADRIRLGRGGGYYDRLFASAAFKAIRVAVCFSFQLRENLPREAHDQPVNAIVTDAGIV